MFSKLALALLLGLAVLVALPSTLLAQQRDDVQPATKSASADANLLPHSLFTTISTNPAEAILQQSNAAERQLWTQALAQAEARHRRSTWFLLGAAGLVGLGLVYQAAEDDTGYQYYSGIGSRMHTTLYLIGAGVGVYGFIERTGAQRDINELRAEGQRRGFTTTLGPTGLTATYTLRF